MSVHITIKNIMKGFARLVEYPTAVPKAIGRRIEAAGLAKTAAGSVREGMNVVIVAVDCREYRAPFVLAGSLVL